MRALALAEELEVSVRTIDRDIDELSGAGRSDDCDYGGNGGVRLEDGYRTQLTGMTASEWGCYRRPEAATRGHHQVSRERTLERPLSGSALRG